MGVTAEDYKKFNELFPESMSTLEVFEELDKMDPQEAAPYNEIACDDFFLRMCMNYSTYNFDGFGDEAVSLKEYRTFKLHYQKIPSHTFYDAFDAFLRKDRSGVKKSLHSFIQAYATGDPFKEEDLTVVILAFKNAYDGFWSLVKDEILRVPHDEIVIELCEVIDAFCHAETNDEAVQILEEAYQHHPGSHIINEMLGVAYYDGKRYGNAIAAFERLYLEDEKCYDAILNTQDQINFFLGYANDKLKDRKAAIKYYEKAIENNPACPYAANNLGYAYYREKQYEKAYAILKRCLDEKLEQDIVYPVNNFARVLLAMGRNKEAKEFLRNAPAKISKAIREKIEAAPDKDSRKPSPEVIIEENEESSEPVAKANIQRKGEQFQSEKVLEDELMMRMEAGMDVFGMPLKIYRRHGEYGRQYIFPNGRLDILAEDSEHNLYIIELKKDSGYDDAYKQTVEYIEWFQKHKARGKKVYGIICLNAPNRALVDAVRKDDRVKLYEYQISYTEIK